MDETKLSASDLARALGVSRQMVSMYCRTGKIEPEMDGTFNLETVRRQLAVSLGEKRGGPARRGERAENAGAIHMLHRPRTDLGEARPAGPTQAQLQREVLVQKIRREKLRGDELERSLVNRAEVEAQVEARFRDDAEALYNWPGRIAAEFAAELGISDQLTREVLDKYVRKFMTERSKDNTNV